MKLWTVIIGAAFLMLCGLVIAQDKLPKRPAQVGKPPTARVADDATKAERDGGFHIIGYLEKRDLVITIKSGSKGTVYSVASNDGKVLHENLSAEQLKAQSPELHDLIKTGVAGDARAREPKIDASLRAY